MKNNNYIDVITFSKILSKIKSNDLYYIEKRIFELTLKLNLDISSQEYIYDFIEHKEEELGQKAKYKNLRIYLSSIEY